MKEHIQKQEKIFIGVSWPYANGNLHIGHLAGQNITCDVFARYHRLKGNKVLMVSGSDSHGAPVMFKAEELGKEPLEYSLESHQRILDTFKSLGLIYENYTRTTTDNHRDVVQNIFLVLKEFEYLEEQVSQQYYDPKAKRFLPDRYVRGTCPKCNAENARGDECPECGEYLNPEDLINPYSAISDATPIIKDTNHFYLNLKKSSSDLKIWIDENSHRWRTWVSEFSKGWVKQGLEPRCVTRDLSYGVKVPLDGWEDKVIYVWLEAVVGYLSASIEWADKLGSPSAWEDFWKDQKAKHYYFIAGGNVPFHTIIWPAEIIGYNKKYGTDVEDKYKLPGETSSLPLVLPYDIPANNLLLYKGKKMSKGDNTGVTIEDLVNTYNPDLIRYFFVKYAPENHDREYTWKDLIDANNNELVANLGNFINRVLTFTYTKFDKKIPNGKLDDEVQEAILSTFKNVGNSLEKTKFIKSIEQVLELGKFANKYFNDQEPWVTLKTDREKAENTIYNSIQIVNAMRVLIKPFMPFTSQKISNILNIKDEYDPNIDLENKGFVSEERDMWYFEEIEVNTNINEPTILFTKLEYTEDIAKLDRIETKEQSFDGILIGKIINKQKHPSSDKLAIYSVDIAKEKVIVVAGDTTLEIGDMVPYVSIGATLPGKKKIVIEKKEIEGVVSNGMLASEKELGLGKDSKRVMRLTKDKIVGETYS